MRRPDRPSGPLRRLFHLGIDRPSLAESVDWEIEHYLAEETDQLIAEGLTLDEARQEAERRFGDRTKQRKRMLATDRRGMAMRWKDERWIDVRGVVGEAFRSVRRSPGFTAAVVLTLGLGLGVNAAMFGVVDRVLLSPPAHIRDADDVRRVMRNGPFFGRIMTTPAVSYPDIVDLRTVPGLVSVGATSGRNTLTLGSGPDARRVQARRITHDLITTLGVEAERGRFFGPDDDRPDSPLTVVVSHEFWETSMGSDPDVLGGTLTLAGHEATMIGVAPRGFTGTGLEAVDVWLPAVAFEVQRRNDDGFLTSLVYDK